MEFKRVKVYISFDGMCSRLWLTPHENAKNFNTMLLDGLETIHNRAGIHDDANNITWDLVFTPGGRVSVEMIANGGQDRVAMSPMKQSKKPLLHHTDDRYNNNSKNALPRDLNISYEKMS